jgi:hypothetical protein
VQKFREKENSRNNEKAKTNKTKQKLTSTELFLPDNIFKAAAVFYCLINYNMKSRTST